jgi:hypothetical protein
MTQYAHTSDQKPFILRPTWKHPVTKTTHMGMEVRTPEQLAALGLYPVRREPLEPGASGYGEMYLYDGEFVIPSLPGDPDAVQQAYLDGLSCSRTQAWISIEDATNGLVFDTPIDLTTPFNAWRTDPTRTLRELAFLNHEVWKYRDPIVQSVGTQLFGLTDAQLITLFEYAKKQ